jgi:hypothetical protein
MPIADAVPAPSRNANRLVCTLSKMSLEDAKALGIDEADRWCYVRVDSAKVNIAPAAATARWFKLVGVPLGNGNIVYPSGDEVQTVEEWTPADPLILVDDENLRGAILAEIKNAEAGIMAQRIKIPRREPMGRLHPLKSAV